MPVELVTLVGDGQAPPVPLEQRHPEIAFELLDRLGHRRLGNREALGGPGYRSLLRDRDEVLELPDGERHGVVKASAMRYEKRPRRRRDTKP